jgi:hypothetical protein
MTDTLQVTDVGLEVEEVDTVNEYKVSAIGLMVEYSPSVATGRVYGPSLQAI